MSTINVRWGKKTIHSKVYFTWADVTENLTRGKDGKVARYTVALPPGPAHSLLSDFIMPTACWGVC
jgi:hypothetical protein